MKKILECVPNFSEGNDLNVIKKITDAIESVSGISLLNVEPGRATNRTVVTFVGNPDAVIEAAFNSIKKAGEIIDMRKHKGKHPRFGSTDVCPLVPVLNVSMEEAVGYARRLAERVGNKLGIPVYCYEYAAFKKERESLANCRSGEYEGLKHRLLFEKWRPDYGPAEWTNDVAKTGATAIGARKFLVAYNINLNTRSVEIAGLIASDIRESGKIIYENNSKGNVKGNPKRIPGSLKKIRAIGWYIEEYKIAQVSINILDTDATPIHVVFEEVKKQAKKYGVQVTGSELIGLIPLKDLVDTGKYYIQKLHQNIEVTEEETIRTAIYSLGLDVLKPFDLNKKVLEFVIGEKGNFY